MADLAGAYVGTSGWNYKHWRNIIYPERFPQSRWLGFMVERFDTVEVNTSFYRIPKAETIAKWQRETPGSFLFALKLWRGITHYKKLLDAGRYVKSFLEVVEVLEPARRAPLLIQLPPNQRKNIPKLEAFIREFREIAAGDWRLVVEFRNDEWLAPDVYSALDGLNVALCLHDIQGKAAATEPNGADFVYVRRHGSGAGRYTGDYSPEQLETDAALVQGWVGQGRDVYVYYNNDIGGHAFWNAMELRRLVGRTSSGELPVALR